MAATTLPGVLLTGTHAARPAATAVASGTLYACSDHSLIYQSDGATWSTWASLSGTGAPTTADYLVGTANGSLSAEIVVGTSPGGELGGTWASPTVDATHSGSAHPTSSENRVTGDVSIVSADTFYDGPSLTLAAGTYDLTGRVTIKNTSGGGTQITAKLWNGTTGYDATQEWGETNNGIYTLTLVKASLVLGGSTTVKVSVAQSAGGGTILATVPNNATGVTNMASVLRALRIA